MSGGRKHKNGVSVIKLAGLGLGAYFGLIAPFSGGSNVDPHQALDNPLGAANNLFGSITGLDPMSGWNFNPNALAYFWSPVASLWLLDIIGKKFLHRNIKLTKELSLF